MQLLPVNVGWGQQCLSVLVVFQDDPPLDEGVPEGRHDEVVSVAPVVDNVLQGDVLLFFQVLEEVLVELLGNAADLKGKEEEQKQRD